MYLSLEFTVKCQSRLLRSAHFITVQLDFSHPPSPNFSLTEVIRKVPGNQGLIDCIWTHYCLNLKLLYTC